jgi:hypothetical protein
MPRYLKILKSSIKSSVKLWEGKSPYNGDFIFASVSGLDGSSKNPKTGPMSQLWILSKDITPMKAIFQSPGDDSICGDCLFSPKRALVLKKAGKDYTFCYVGKRAYQAPRAIWNSQVNQPVELELGLELIKLSNLPMRLGAYGDPAMLPESLVRDIIKRVPSWTAYTHQYNRKWAWWLKDIAMASVNNETDAVLFQQLGWRTFRVTKTADSNKNEIVCPNYTNDIQCIDCNLCDGSIYLNDKRKNITIPAH